MKCCKSVAYSVKFSILNTLKYCRNRGNKVLLLFSKHWAFPLPISKSSRKKAFFGWNLSSFDEKLKAVLHIGSAHDSEWATKFQIAQILHVLFFLFINASLYSFRTTASQSSVCFQYLVFVPHPFVAGFSGKSKLLNVKKRNGWYLNFRCGLVLRQLCLFQWV